VCWGEAELCPHVNSFRQLSNDTEALMPLKKGSPVWPLIILCLSLPSAGIVGMVHYAQLKKGF
jgi:hypothetical protein